MKKLISIIIVIILLTAASTVVSKAATPTPSQGATTTPSISVSPTPQDAGEKINAQINQLKERIASKVAELNLVEKRGVIGTVNDTSGNQITFNDLAGEKRYIDVDEITKFSSPSANSSFGLSDLVKGTIISVLGQYNKNSQRILARFIDTYTTPTFLSGRISNLDTKNYTITVTDENQKQTNVDVQTLTVISNYTKDSGIAKYGFSKLVIGDRVMVTGFPDKTDKTLLIGSRVLDLAELPENPNIIVDAPTDIITPSISPAPTIKVSSSPTKTPTKTVTKTPTPTKK